MLLHVHKDQTDALNMKEVFNNFIQIKVIPLRHFSTHYCILHVHGY